MIISDTSIPVLVLNCKLGALGIMRSLGSLGIAMAGVDADPKSPAMLSKYCKKKFFMDLDLDKSEEYLNFILKIKDEIKQKAIIIPTSDETAVFVAQYYNELSEFFITPQNSADLFSNLMKKDKMYHLAVKYEVSTPYTEFPQNLEDVKNYLKNPNLPVMLKAIDGDKLFARTLKKMVIVNNEDELLRNYQDLEDKTDPNLMIQELIPGDDDQVFIFNGYFDENSDCKIAFTGHKIRQFPVHVGCASLGINFWNEDVNKITTDFMKKLGYRGILDIGYRLDPRDGKYKVLDINPRIGGAFRIFTSNSGMDVVRALYLDLSKQKSVPGVSKNGRRWIIEDLDILAVRDYYNEGSITFWQWLKSLKDIEEGAWFNWKDPFPFFWMFRQLLKQITNKIFKKGKQHKG